MEDAGKPEGRTLAENTLDPYLSLVLFYDHESDR